MTKTHNLYIFAPAIFVTIFAFVSYVHANPSFFTTNTSTSCTSLSSSATTSPIYQTAGTATTTVCLNASLGTASAYDNGSLVLYRNASAATSQTKIQFEYSMNCLSGNPDWFADRVSLSGFGATTTPAIIFSGNNSYTWQAASSTLGGSGVSTQGLDTIAIPVSVPTACVRAVITVPVGAASSSIWAQIVGKRQQQ